MSENDALDVVSAAEGEWLSRPKIAELAKRGEKTIDRDVSNHQLEYKTGPKGTKLFRVADFVRIGRITATAIPNGLTGDQAVEVLRLQEQVTVLQRENGELAGRLAEIRSAFALAQDQLAAKDTQIKAADANLQRVLTLAARSAA